MLGDWLRSLELPIAFSEFERLPRHPAYKYEYFDGRAVLTPRPRYARALLDLTAFSPPATAASLAGAHLRPMEPADWNRLPELLAAAFHNVAPLVTLEPTVRLTVARECVEHTRAGGDGALVDPACCVAVETRGADCVVGAIVITLITCRDQGVEDLQRAHLTWIMVHPWRFSQGLGGALLSSAVTVLRGLGYSDLASTFLVGNDRAVLWHWRRGFRLVPGAHPVVPPLRNGEGDRG
ncbi:MAG TPA: GNAT family N-acetyltransferase [Gemmatimonadales bacterium]|jgi:GNAT superfamily N-acetyltransferase